MVGKTVWVSAGGQMDYYPYAAHRANYAKTVGTLLGAEPLVIKDAFEQVAPKSATFRIPGGDKQVLLAFTMPKSADPAKEYAVPVGYRQGGEYTFYTDEIFFYDDPHELYNHWGPQVWQAVDAHQVILGMNERQVQLSLGQVSQEREPGLRQPGGGVREPGPPDGCDVCGEQGDGVPAGPGDLTRPGQREIGGVGFP